MRFIILIVIVVVAATAGYFTLQMASSSQSPQQVITKEEPQVEAVNVLVARARIPVGTVITEDMVDQQPWPKHLLLNGFVVSGSPDSNVVGMVAHSDFQAQEPLNKSKLASADDANFIAAALPSGMRALTVAVDAISGVAGYIYPGDHVDVVLTHNIPGEIKLPSAMRYDSSKLRAGYSETLLGDVTVLAIDSRAQPEKDGDDPRSRQQSTVKVPTNITLSVSPENAQKIRLGEKNGTLSLVLRSLKDREKTDRTPPTEVGSLTGVGEAAVGETSSSRVVIVRGVKEGLGSVSNFAPPMNFMPTAPIAPMPPQVSN